jgi:hypothetical protein
MGQALHDVISNLMLTETEKLEAPLQALKQLCRCLDDSDESAEIRNDLAVIMWRTDRLLKDLQPAHAFMPQDDLGAALGTT